MSKHSTEHPPVRCGQPSLRDPRGADQVPARPLPGRHRLRRCPRTDQDRRPGPDQRVHPEPDLRRGGPSRGAGGLLPERQSRGQEPAGDLRGADEVDPRLPRARRPPRAHGRAGHRPGPHVPHAGQPDRGADARRPGAHPRGHPRPQPVAPRDVDVRLRGPDLHDAGHHAAHRGAGHRGARMGGRARGAGWSSSGRPRCRATAGPARSAWRSSTRSGRRSSTTTSWWPCTPRTAGTSATPTTGWAATPRCCPFQPQAFRMLSAWRPVEDAVSALVCHGALSRFPELKVAVIENGSSWVEPLLKNMADVYKKMPQDFARGPGRGHQAQHLHQPVLGGGPRRAGRADRGRPRAVRIRLPAPRGSGRSGELRGRARRASTTRPSRKIMGGNLARLMNVADLVAR